MEIRTQNFEQNANIALEVPTLKKAIRKATTRFNTLSKQSLAQLEDVDGLRNRIKKIKEDTINNLEYYLEMLEKSVQIAGGKVHKAKDGREASEIIAKIAIDNRVNKIVKGKSMVSEEINLNEVLIKEGMDVIETDLGEYIIQLAGETPSHIIVPAVHKTREDVSRLFVEKLGIENTDEVEKLTDAARKTLRKEFCSADMGISGVNFAVAETGSIVIVENEGNGRLSTTMPKIHIALMGMEKVIPTLEDLALFLKILARSATGQKMTSYVSIITGPRKEDEADGPEQFHLVIIDNGRSKILADKDMKESLYCIRCGACLNVCPVFNNIGGHAYGWVYPGPIGSVITPQFLGLETAKMLPYASTLCGACYEVCPVRIPIPHLLLKLRNRISERTDGIKIKREFAERIVMSLWMESLRSKFLYELLSSFGAFITNLIAKNGKIKYLPFVLSKWTDERDFPPLAKKSFRKRWEEIKDG